MVIRIDSFNRWLIFSLETKDFVNEAGHKFVQELSYRLSDDNYIVEEFKYLTPSEQEGYWDVRSKVIWKLDFDECIKIFIEMFKKYFNKCYQTQLVKIV